MRILVVTAFLAASSCAPGGPPVADVPAAPVTPAYTYEVTASYPHDVRAFTEGLLIEDGQLDLVPLVRETVLLELDLERQCRDDCAWLCPGCGIDRNVDSCECDTSVADDRWAALEGFVADDET